MLNAANEVAVDAFLNGRIRFTEIASIIEHVLDLEASVPARCLADVLTADASEAFAQAPGGYYDEDLSDKLVKYLFAPRNSIDPNEAFRLFRGRDADVNALFRARGFPTK